MAQNKYCPACGKPNAYVNGAAPTTCAGCKKPLSMAAFIPKVEPEPPKASKVTKAKITGKKIDITLDADEWDEDNDWDGEIVIPTCIEIDVDVPKRATMADLGNGAALGGLSTQLPQIPE